MRNYVGLDVSLKTTSICILDEKGKRLLEGEVDSIPEAVGDFLKRTGLEIEQIGLESGTLTHYLKKGLLKMNYRVAVMESRKMAAILAWVDLFQPIFQLLELFLGIFIAVTIDCIPKTLMPKATMNYNSKPPSLADGATFFKG